MTKKLVQGRLGTWTRLLFHELFLGFARGERRLLEEALLGLTDKELAARLQISLSGIKKAWQSIYSRVERNGSGILPTASSDHEESNRDKRKKHRLLTYIRRIQKNFAQS